MKRRTRSRSRGKSKAKKPKVKRHYGQADCCIECGAPSTSASGKLLCEQCAARPAEFFDQLRNAHQSQAVGELILETLGVKSAGEQLSRTELILALMKGPTHAAQKAAVVHLVNKGQLEMVEADGELWLQRTEIKSARVLPFKPKAKPTEPDEGKEGGAPTG